MKRLTTCEVDASSLEISFVCGAPQGILRISDPSRPLPLDEPRLLKVTLMGCEYDFSSRNPYSVYSPDLCELLSYRQGES